MCNNNNSGGLRRFDIVHDRVAGSRRSNHCRAGVHLVRVHAGIRPASPAHQHLLLAGSGSAALVRTQQLQKPVGRSGSNYTTPTSDPHGADRHHRLRRLLAAVLGLPGTSQHTYLLSLLTNLRKRATNVHRVLKL